jgi:dTDP-4-dehydrorhamnose 3,5-epimerase|tara:strand:- start:1246 stop:1791 length:546 start_codon:yes stop_codon:yes gene_type:complete
MNLIKSTIDDLFVLEPSTFSDNRGYFMESYKKEKFNDLLGNIDFVQENESGSFKGVLRGLHFQHPPYSQTKLVRCISGKVLDVAVDLRKKSKSYGNFFSIELSSENKKQLLIPNGFAHGFQVLSNYAIVNYKVDNYYNPKYESGIIWNDNDLVIDWSNDVNPILSDKDLKLDSFNNFNSPF